MSKPAVHRTIFAVDVEGFSDRTNPHQVAIRNTLYSALSAAFTRSGVPWDGCYHEDRGDGVLVLIPPSVPKNLLAVPVPRELAAALREHNRTCAAEDRIRLRAAVNAGEVHRDDHGVAGASVNLTFRLLASPTLKALLAKSPGDLALIASGWFFDDVVRHEPGGSGSFRQIRVSVKETSTRAWVCLPDQPMARPPGLSRLRRRIATAVAVITIVTIGASVAVGAALWPRTINDGALPVPSTTSTTTAPPPTNPTGTTPTPESGTGRADQPQPETLTGSSRPDMPDSPSPPAVSGSATPPSGQPSSSAPPSAPPTQGPPSADPLDDDPASVQQERPVELSTQSGQDSVDPDWWRQVHDQSGDLLMDATGVTARLGAQLAVIEDSPEPTRDRCRQVKAWTTRVDFASLHVGSQLCAISRGGRYAMLQVRALPGSPGSNGRFVFYGRTWW